MIASHHLERSQELRLAAYVLGKESAKKGNVMERKLAAEAREMRKEARRLQRLAAKVRDGLSGFCVEKLVNMWSHICEKSWTIWGLGNRVW